MSRARVWFFSVCGVAVAYVTVVAYASFIDGAMLPLRIDSLMRAGLAAALVVTALWCVLDVVQERIVDQLEARIAHRLVRPDDTSEIPRIVIPSVAVGTATVYQASQRDTSVGWDPKVLEIGHRLSDRLHAPLMRHDD